MRIRVSFMLKRRRAKESEMRWRSFVASSAFNCAMCRGPRRSYKICENIVIDKSVFIVIYVIDKSVNPCYLHHVPLTHTRTTQSHQTFRINPCFGFSLSNMTPTRFIQTSGYETTALNVFTQRVFVD